MKFTTKIAIALFGLGIASIGSFTRAQDIDFEGVEIETIPVAEDIYMLVGEGGNIGVSTGEDGVCDSFSLNVLISTGTTSRVQI